jgi:Co/Zn/Cd efflux system component
VNSLDKATIFGYVMAAISLIVLSGLIFYGVFLAFSNPNPISWTILYLAALLVLSAKR